MTQTAPSHSASDPSASASNATAEAVALVSQGLKLHQAGQLAAAAATYRRALAIKPDEFDALHLLGVIFHQCGHHAEAAQQIDIALARRPDDAFALNNLGIALGALRQFAEALSRYERALTLRPDYVDAWLNRGNALLGLGRFAEAVASYDRALVLRPDLADALVNRGITLHAMKRPEEALADYDQALTMIPGRAEAHYNRANVLYTLKRFDDAIASYDRALALQPDYAEAHANRGVVLQDVRRFDEALAAYISARTARPDFADAYYNEALCRLLIGDFERGFAVYERRWEADQHRGFKRDFAQPLWTGAEEIAGKTILLHAEQGFGDTIQFCRYAPELAARGARVVLEVQEPLRALMTTLPGVAEIFSHGETLPGFDLHCPMLSLPKAFGTELGSISNAVPYLRAADDGVTHWRDRIGAGGRRTIGTAWSGRPTHKKDHHRSIALGDFLEIFAGIDAAIVSLQQEVRDADAATLQARTDVIHFGEDLKDFADTAALIENLDLVVAVDTSVVHLAGALGKPVWVLLPYMPDWRWQLDRDDSPWYPSARLFRQDASRAWDSVIARVNAALRD